MSFPTPVSVAVINIPRGLRIVSLLFGSSHSLKSNRLRKNYVGLQRTPCRMLKKFFQQGRSR